ncbi:V-type proton ATPase subunit F 1 [Thelohanellus kitauei]|uniref:V-type proton ATPase subunit F 1 n=1 Tax=Thelohanellus kitauei TaxID=669202 RepID=A0A0C2I857_THEKT|nr:V-type proton ATPase subunit F 1 [Thelohanellus kitauei]
MSGTHLIGLIGDEDTCVGFLLAGAGDVNKQRQKNFMAVTKDTTYSEIEEFFTKLLSRADIAIILITQKVFQSLISNHKRVIPTIVEIPSKDHPYDSAKDPVLKRVRAFLGHD